MISNAPTYTSVRHMALRKSFATLTNESVLHGVVMIWRCTSIQDRGWLVATQFGDGYASDEFLLSITHLRRLESAAASALLLTAYMHCMELECGGSDCYGWRSSGIGGAFACV